MVMQYVGGGRKVDLGPGRARPSVIRSGAAYGRLFSDPLSMGGKPMAKLQGQGVSREFSIGRKR